MLLRDVEARELEPRKQQRQMQRSTDTDSERVLSKRSGTKEVIRALSVVSQMSLLDFPVAIQMGGLEKQRAEISCTVAVEAVVLQMK